MVIRIMLMVPLYAIASLISLFSLEAAFFIDAVRDVYEVRPVSFAQLGVSRTALSCKKWGIQCQGKGLVRLNR